MSEKESNSDTKDISKEVGLSRDLTETNSDNNNEDLTHYLKRLKVENDEGREYLKSNLNARKKLAEKVSKSNIDIPQEKLELAVREGNKSLSNYLMQRAKKIDKPMIFVPIDEGVRHFRLGTQGYDGLGLTPAKFHKIMGKLLKANFPDIQASESRAVNSTWLRSISKTNPKASLVVQHFPSGGAMIEITETEGVHINKPFLKDFKMVIENGVANGVMLSHCSYNYNEANFPGIEALKAKTPLHPALSKVDFNTIPASLNPVAINYLHEKMGFKGAVIPDWYDMGAIAKFVDPLKINIPNCEDHDWAERELKTFILAVYSGVSTITGIRINTILHANWQEYKKKFPTDFADLESAMDRTITQNYEILKEKDSPKLDVNKLSFKEKILFLMPGAYQAAAYSFDENIKKQNFKFFKVFSKKKFDEGTDVWSRYGVMTLLQRQFIVEHIAGKKFTNPPTTIIEEEEWFKNLMKNSEFRKIYDNIDWESAPIQKWLDEIADNKFQGK